MVHTLSRIKMRLDQIGQELEIENELQSSIEAFASLLQAPKIQSDTFRSTPGSMSTRINSEFRKNMFIVDPKLPPITSNLPPKELFEYLDLLGTGSCGNVVKMRHKPTGRICAVKQMRRTLNDDENKRIYMDLKIVLQCECENIVKCFGYFIKESEVWICMELMTTCLGSLLHTRRRAFPEKLLGAVATAMVNALHYLKKKHDIIHRDVKPSNILINEEGQIKLCDFGVSGRLVDSPVKSRAVGCKHYMAPESFVMPYNSKADVWSLGITLYELATARSPYADCESYLEIMSKIVNDDPPELPNDMNFSSKLREFVSACLTKDFNQRPDFKQLLDHEFIIEHKNNKVNLSDLDD